MFSYMEAAIITISININIKSKNTKSVFPYDIAKEWDKHWHINAIFQKKFLWYENIIT